MFDSLRPVNLGTAKTFEDLKSGFSLRVVGDGKVEPAISERFTSSAFIEHFDDRRLRGFATAQKTVGDKVLPEAQTRPLVDEALKKHLGEQWTLAKLTTRGGSGIGVVEAVLRENGAGEQSYTVDTVNGTVRLATEVRIDNWTVTHTLSGKQGQSEFEEAATFQKG